MIPPKTFKNVNIVDIINDVAHVELPEGRTIKVPVKEIWHPRDPKVGVVAEIEIDGWWWHREHAGR